MSKDDKTPQDKSSVEECGYVFAKGVFESCFEPEDPDWPKTRDNVHESVFESAYHDGLEYQLEDGGLSSDALIETYGYDELSIWFDAGMKRFIEGQFSNGD